MRSEPKQKRGKQRVEIILNSASELFAEVGYDNATIIEIAARAGTSVGSIYQFFSNKEGILRALVEKYVEDVSRVYTDIDAEAFPSMTVEEIMQAVLLPLKEFIRENRDFQAIFSNSTGSNLVEELMAPINGMWAQRTNEIFINAYPQISPKELKKYNLICMTVVKSLLGLAHHSDDISLDEVFEEMQHVLVRYMTPVFEEMGE
ncbi:MAG: TetR/AcrR family transcriptional regulator [Chloroflexi bacterium]|nr:TetR/AcrR family transcriptional regulator [Chloroflexota bacterium]